MKNIASAYLLTLLVFPGKMIIGTAMFSDKILQVSSTSLLSTVDPPIIIPSVPPSIASVAMFKASSGVCSSGSINVK